jgi:hypothetical protein
MAGTVTAGDTSAAFTAVDGQVVSFTDNSTNATFTGTDRNSAHSTEASFEITGAVTFDRPCDPAQSSPH